MDFWRATAYMLSALSAIARPCLFVTRVNQSKTVKVEIMKFSSHDIPSL